MKKSYNLIIESCSFFIFTTILLVDKNFMSNFNTTCHRGITWNICEGRMIELAKNKYD